MSLFNRIMASVGIGSAKVDTLLEKSSYYPGEEIRGVIRIYGGAVEQRIEGIDLAVMTYYTREVNDTKVQEKAQLGVVRATGAIQLRANEQKDVEFSFRLPVSTPLTVGRTPVFIQTTADIRSAVDPTDQDRIDVVATPAMRAVMQAVESLGFRLREVETIYAPRLGGSHSPFVQEWEYKPQSGAYRGRLDELEVVFLRQQGGGAELLLQIDRKAVGLFGHFAEAMEMDESFVRVTVSEQDVLGGPQRVASLLDQVISRYAH
ncbi:sporulation-control protein [Paenibacillus cellulosilyticus]|uniref:Sporulation-control protein n=1 Tax=Paenibacillus cellulosilyticus TaxID=375489 RepID=A0A2V2YVD1_9BACL|nr:sporulation protein [Paenibacillus cellulosilyticus]PWW05182.1 sporulation-control protein [Paenibacillus cellulosilyticus]QKS43510.1 sporulation protein [Paenibacillus cellulosilyticus]